MGSLSKNRVIAALAVAAVGVCPTIASAQAVEQQQSQASPGEVPQATATDAVQPAATPQAPQSEPPPPIPVPPVEPPSEGLHISSAAVLGVGAVILAAGAYFLFHKKKNPGDAGGTTAP